jgi:hypothetical protein
MGRIAAIVLAAAALAGCGQAGAPAAGGGAPVPQPDAGRGPLDSRAVSAPATRTCGQADSPPVPLIRARVRDDRVRIEYELLARPDGCEPVAIHVTANSVDKLDNIAPASGGGGPIRLNGDKGVVVLKLPPLDLPPYEARASTYAKSGARSETTTVPVPVTGDYCRRKASAAACIRRARAKFMRCLRGQAPRAACPDYVWNARPLIPYEPLRGVTRAGLERSFAFMAARGGAEFVSVQCSSLRYCIATWRSYWGILRARYEVSGYGSRTGCWIAERRAILEEAEPPEHVAPLSHVVSDRQSACVDWVR